MNIADLKLCRNCRHLSEDSQRCLQKAPTKLDYVHGHHQHFQAQTERESCLPEDCGPAARFFEPLAKG